MQTMTNIIRDRARALMAEGKANRLIGWKVGEFFFDRAPAVFDSPESLDELIVDSFSAPNLSKYLIEESRKEGKIIALIKPCDSFSFNQLVKEHRINRENVYVMAIPCGGMLDIDKIRAQGVKGLRGVSETESGEVAVDSVYGEKRFPRAGVLMEKCLFCKSLEHAVADEKIDFPVSELDRGDRFEQVSRLEGMSAQERFDFWRGELSRCIRCNACRNVCPACSCIQCVFDNPASGVAAKSNADDFEENMFHIIRAFHVAGRCTDCGECSRVCPQHIPLHLLNRKFIKDINELYGEYQAGADTESRAPLTDYTKTDAEPGVVYERGGKG